MHRPSRSTSRGRKSDAPSPSRRLASKSPSRSKTSIMRSSPTKGLGVTKSPTSNKNVGKDLPKKGNFARSPARKTASSKSPVKKAPSKKGRPASKSPSRASKRTPSKQKEAVKSSERPATRSRSQSRPLKHQNDSNSTLEMPSAPASNSSKLIDSRSSAFSKRFDPSFLQPFTKSTAYPLRSTPYGATAARETPGEMAIRQRTTASTYPSTIPKLVHSRKMTELKKFAPKHFRRFWRFYFIIFMLTIIVLIIYHFGYNVQRTLKQLQKQVNGYISSMRKQ